MIPGSFTTRNYKVYEGHVVLSFEVKSPRDPHVMERVEATQDPLLGKQQPLKPPRGKKKQGRERGKDRGEKRRKSDGQHDNSAQTDVSQMCTQCSPIKGDYAQCPASTKMTLHIYEKGQANWHNTRTT